jgi:hypothetical protein
MADVL